MAFRWRADDGPAFNAGLVTLLIFQGIRTNIAKKPYIFVIFQGGGSGPPVLLWIRQCSIHMYMLNRHRLTVSYQEQESLGTFKRFVNHPEPEISELIALVTNRGSDEQTAA